MQPVVFFGSAPLSTIVLSKLIEAKVPIVAVFTKPDKPVGRHLNLTPNPVKVLAQKHNIPVTDQLVNWSTGKLQPVGLVAAYGQIIPQSILDKFSGQIYNIHPSLLPKYRGPSPLQQQILDGLTQTGVTIIQLDAKMDHGPIVAQIKATIHPDDTSPSLGERLFALGASWFIENYLQIKNWELKIQDHSQATYTKLLTRQDGFVPWEKFQHFRDATQIHQLFRAYHPWPGVWSLDPQGRRVKLASLQALSITKTSP